IDSCAYTADGKIGVYCTYSQEYIRRAYNYWFTFYQVNKRTLKGAAETYLVLCCGSIPYVLLIPLKDLEPLLPRLYKIKTDEREGWDICILNKQGKWLLLLKEDEP